MGYWVKESEGYLQHITVARSGVVWGSNHSETLSDVIYKKIDDGGGWKEMPALPNNDTQVYISSLSCASDGTMMVTDIDHGIYRWYEYALRWNPFPLARMKLISVGSANHIWGRGIDDLPYEYTGDGIFTPHPTVGPIFNLAVGNDGTVLVVTNDGTIYRYLGKEEFRKLEGLQAKIIKVVAANAIYATDLNNILHKYVGEGIWHPVPLNDINGNPLSNQYVMDFDFADDGTAYIVLGQVNTEPNIYCYIPA